MLSSTADSLFWMSRYAERAENTVRMLNAHLESSLLAGGRNEQERTRALRVVLKISELEPAYLLKYSTWTSAQVMHFMVADIENPSSIYNALRHARENARAVRGAITTELWEALNATWLKLQTRLMNDAWLLDITEFFEWVKHRIHHIRGITGSTMPRDDAYRFFALGTALERADNMARLLDVKFFEGAVNDTHINDAQINDVQDLDAKGEFYHWAAVLRSVSGYEIYRKTYHDTITPARVAELLILRADMPRSLLVSVSNVQKHLLVLANTRSDATLRQVGLLQAQLKFAHIDDILQQGLHTYLTAFLARMSEIGQGINRDFLIA
jgi:uncharacterized alpha-E superfamily protein